MDSRHRVLDVDARVRRKLQPEFAATAEHLGRQRGSQLGHQDRERGRRGGRRGIGPECVNQFVAGRHMVAVERQVGEQQPALAAG